VTAAIRRALRLPGAGLVVGLLGVLAASGVVQVLSGHVEVLSLVVVYQLVVLAVSGAYGVAAGLWTSLASVLAFNVFFLPPTGTLTITDTRNWVAIAVFAVTAVVTSRLAGGFRRQREEAEARRRDADLLTGLAETALADVGPGRPGERFLAAAAGALGVTRCALVLDPAVGAAAGHVTPSASGFSVPLLAVGRPIGVLEVGPADPAQEQRWARPGFPQAVAGVAALAVERERLIEATLETEGLRRSDELKTALLRGVSHEFRTPLTAIRTAAHALSERPDDPGSGALLQVMTEESARLERLVANLLDLSRLEAGALEAHLDWCAPQEIAAGAVEAAGPLLAGTPVAIDVPDDLPLVRADPVLVERILVNLLHNAVRHGAPPISIQARVAGDRLEIAVADGGNAGLSEADFAPFTAGPRTGGTGIGLALSRGLAEAQGGRLELEPGLTTRVVLSLPLAVVPLPSA
jgi:two-component system sensor histidine kinase KdpD